LLTGGDRSIGVVRVRTKTTVFFFLGNCCTIAALSDERAGLYLRAMLFGEA
jgi:hypothetical protein